MGELGGLCFSPWPDRIPGLGERSVDALTTCSACERSTLARYGPHPLCLYCARWPTTRQRLARLLDKLGVEAPGPEPTPAAPTSRHPDLDLAEARFRDLIRHSFESVARDDVTLEAATALLTELAEIARSSCTRGTDRKWLPVVMEVA